MTTAEWCETKAQAAADEGIERMEHGPDGLTVVGPEGCERHLLGEWCDIDGLGFVVQQIDWAARTCTLSNLLTYPFRVEVIEVTPAMRAERLARARHQVDRFLASRAP